MAGENGPREYTIPDNDDRERLVCPECNYIVYDNPKIVVGAVATNNNGKILLCRRAIEPRTGYWTIPAGYLEQWETLSEGTQREAREEARAELELGPMLAIYDLPHIAQVQMFYRAHLCNADIAPGSESREVGLFEPDALPWEELAFPTVTKILEQYKQTRDSPYPVPAYEVIRQSPEGAV
jgi:ADP-ribose pyrophosphatase YjhB (NUDIX family)